MTEQEKIGKSQMILKATLRIEFYFIINFGTG